MCLRAPRAGHTAARCLMFQPKHIRATSPMVTVWEQRTVLESETSLSSHPVRAQRPVTHQSPARCSLGLIMSAADHNDFGKEVHAQSRSLFTSNALVVSRERNGTALFSWWACKSKPTIMPGDDSVMSRLVGQVCFVKTLGNFYHPSLGIVRVLGRSRAL
jgi:hypothetical protein